MSDDSSGNGDQAFRVSREAVEAIVAIADLPPGADLARLADALGAHLRVLRAWPLLPLPDADPAFTFDPGWDHTT